MIWYYISPIIRNDAYIRNISLFPKHYNWDHFVSILCIIANSVSNRVCVIHIKYSKNVSFLYKSFFDGFFFYSLICSSHHQDFAGSNPNVINFIPSCCSHSFCSFAANQQWRFSKSDFFPRNPVTTTLRQFQVLKIPGFFLLFNHEDFIFESFLLL